MPSRKFRFFDFQCSSVTGAWFPVSKDALAQPLDTLWLRWRNEETHFLFWATTRSMGETGR